MGSERDFFTQNFLAHAADYDPMARRERYLRTRQLKGRASAGAKPATATKGSPPAKGKGDPVKLAREARIKAIELKFKRARNKIIAEAEARIRNLPPIPKNIKPDTRARLLMARNSDKKQIQQDAKDKIETLGKKIKVAVDRAQKGTATPPPKPKAGKESR